MIKNDTNFVTVKEAPAGMAWRCRSIHHLTPSENAGRHNIYVEAIKNSQKIRNDGTYVKSWWVGQQSGQTSKDAYFDKSMAEPGTNIPIEKGQNFTIKIVDGGNNPSDEVSGLYANFDNDRTGSGNTLEHESFLVNFEWGTSDGVVTTPPITQPVVVSVTPVEPQLPQTDTVYITTALTTVNLRRGPGLSFEVVATITRGTSLELSRAFTTADGIKWHQYGTLWVAEATQDGTKLFGDLDQSVFEKAINFVLNWEGGYVNDPNDPGGETNFGISKRSYPSVDIKNLTRSGAVAIYKRDFWDAQQMDAMDSKIQLMHLNASVNIGVRAASGILQDCGGTQIGYLILLLGYYTAIKNFNIYGQAWVNRSIDAYKKST